jgi:hypothetical protein
MSTTKRIPYPLIDRTHVRLSAGDRRNLNAVADSLSVRTGVVTPRRALRAALKIAVEALTAAANAAGTVTGAFG